MASTSTDTTDLHRVSARADEHTATTPAEELPPRHGAPMTHEDTRAAGGTGPGHRPGRNAELLRAAGAHGRAARHAEIAPRS